MWELRGKMHKRGGEGENRNHARNHAANSCTYISGVDGAREAHVANSCCTYISGGG